MFFLNMAKYGVLLLMCGLCWATEDYSAVDKLRYDLRQLKNLPVYQREGRNAEPAYRKIFQAYSDFNDKINVELKNTGRKYLNSLNSLWIWAVVQDDMNIIEGLYTNFMQLLTAITKTNKPLNSKEWLDFADVVLKHPNVSMPAALGRISVHIIEQNLFTAAYKVDIL